jgi:hypothetical protein
MRLRNLIGLAVTVAVSCVLAGITDAGGTKGGKVVLSDAEFTRLEAADAKALTEALAKDAIDKKAARRVRAAALMIAAYGANSNHPERMQVIESANLVLQLVNIGDIKLARKAAEALYPNIAKPQVAPAKTDKPFQPDIGNYMTVFAPERGGGFGLESEMDDLPHAKGKFTEAQFARLADIGTKAAIIGQVADQFPPDKDDGKMTRKNWLAFAADLRQAAMGLASSAQAKNEAKTRESLEKLGKNCIQCHDVFR